MSLTPTDFHLALEAVVAYVDGELTPGAQARAAAHVAACPQCSYDVRAQREAKILLVGTGGPEVPATGEPDRTYALTLRGTDIVVAGLLPDDLLPVDAGEWVRCTVRNESVNFHPVHLHGHHFQLATQGRPLKDNAVVRARGGELTFDWRADNPGDWMLHCHNHYHMEDGMMRTVTYR